MRGAEFLRCVRRYAKVRGLPCAWHPGLGKGSHGVLTLGTRRTVVRNPKDELKKGTLHAMLTQLGLTSTTSAAPMDFDFNYPVTLTPDLEDGGFVVTFADLPEAVTQGGYRGQGFGRRPGSPGGGPGLPRSRGS